ncbi:hypothetical protein Tco_0981782 [Tanacetum coccineum]
MLMRLISGSLSKCRDLNALRFVHNVPCTNVGLIIIAENCKGLKKLCVAHWNKACWDLRQKRGTCEFLDRSDGRSTLRPAEVLVFGWVGGKHACVDLTGVSPLLGLSSRGFTVGQAALKVASCKVTKHEKTCIENQHVFILFAFDTFGFLAPEAVGLLTRVQRVMNSNVMTPRSTNVMFNRIGFAIQKGLVTQLFDRLPSPTM